VIIPQMYRHPDATSSDVPELHDLEYAEDGPPRGWPTSERPAYYRVHAEYLIVHPVTAPHRPIANGQGDLHVIHNRVHIVRCGDVSCVSDRKTSARTSA
jgi:hypothetical protein